MIDWTQHYFRFLTLSLRLMCGTPLAYHPFVRLWQVNSPQQGYPNLSEQVDTVFVSVWTFFQAFHSNPRALHVGPSPSPTSITSFGDTACFHFDTADLIVVIAFNAVWIAVLAGLIDTKALFNMDSSSRVVDSFLCVYFLCEPVSSSGSMYLLRCDYFCLRPSGLNIRDQRDTRFGRASGTGRSTLILIERCINTIPSTCCLDELSLLNAVSHSMICCS